MTTDRDTNPPANAPAFAKTRWSVVVAAGHAHSDISRKALAELCEIYWYPVFGFLRHKGYDPEQAQDLTQGFFTRLLEKRDLGGADPQRGRFRSYLFSAVQHYVFNQHKHEHRVKRGGGKLLLSLDFGAAEERYRTEPADDRTPEKAYERRWALALLARVAAQLRAEYDARGNAVLFDRLKFVITDDADEAPYRDIAQHLGMTETAVRAAAHRLKTRYRDLLREAVADVVSSPSEIRGEIQFLFSALQP